MSKSIIPEVIAEASNRRSFIKKIGAATAAVGAMSAGLAPNAEAQTTNEMAILNFALNLEYLESQFYSFATTGSSIHNHGIAISGTARGSNPTSGGQISGGKKVYFQTPFIEDVAMQITNDEEKHVVLLRKVLGSKAIACPVINLNALGFGFGNEQEFLKLSRIFEDIGVTAYGGAAGMLTTPAVITAAARILATEGEHVASVRTILSYLNYTTAPALDAVDILPPPSGERYQVLSINIGDGLPSIRTPQEVLYLAYGMKSNATAGGFFPNGVNGAIYMSGTAAKKTSANS